MHSVTKIISGAQTGADQGGLMAAELLGLETGGWMPHGRKTDAGPLPMELYQRWHLQQTASSSYPPRTALNVRDSNGTVLFGNMDSPGCTLTLKLCAQYSKPCLTNPTPEQLLRWCIEHAIAVLNVAGNRKRTNPGICHRTMGTLVAAFAKPRLR